jgi:enoyl-CoA hydratase
MDLKYIRFKERDAIGWIEFSRPEKLNAVNPDVLRDLETAVVGCEENDAIRVIVFQGNKRAFVAGADIENMAQANIKSAYALTDLTMRVQERIADLPKPTIAAISGYALGAGCEIALCCDFRIAADNAIFGLPEITMGIIPGGGGTQRLTRLVGIESAKEIIFKGEMIKAEKAKRIGLVSKVFPLKQLQAEAEALASKLMQKPALALQAAKKAINKALSTSLKEGLQIEQDLFCMLFGTEDQKEGMAAFLEKRKPIFKGK